jgi:hypothetical protein
VGLAGQARQRLRGSQAFHTLKDDGNLVVKREVGRVQLQSPFGPEKRRVFAIAVGLVSLLDPYHLISNLIGAGFVSQFL